MQHNIKKLLPRFVKRTIIIVHNKVKPLYSIFTCLQAPVSQCRLAVTPSMPQSVRCWIYPHTWVHITYKTPFQAINNIWLNEQKQKCSQQSTSNCNLFLKVARNKEILFNSRWNKKNNYKVLYNFHLKMYFNFVLLGQLFIDV